MGVKIFKYRIKFKSASDFVPLTSQAFRMPSGARILRVGFQGSHLRDLFVWAAVDTQKDECIRRIEVYGTGMSLPPSISLDDYVGSAVSYCLVWHIFDGGEEPCEELL